MNVSLERPLTVKIPWTLCQHGLGNFGLCRRSLVTLYPLITRSNAAPLGISSASCEKKIVVHVVPHWLSGCCADWAFSSWKWCALVQSPQVRHVAECIAAESE